MIRRWLFGVGLGVLGLVGLVLGVALSYLHGHPDLPPPETEDLELRPREVAEEDNAYPLLVEAGGQLMKDEEGIVSDFLEGKGDPQELREWLRRHQPAMDRVREALERPDLAFETDYSYNSLVPWISQWMQLGNLMKAQSEWFRREAQLDEAVETTVLLHRFGARVAEFPHFLIDYLVGCALQSHGLSETRVLLRREEMTEGALASLAAAFPGDELHLHGYREAMRAEFMAIRTLTRLPQTHPEDEEAFWEEIDDDDVQALLIYPGFRDYYFQPNRTLTWAAEHFREAIRLRGEPWRVFNPKEVLDLPYSHRSSWERLMEPNEGGYRLLYIFLASVGGIFERSVQNEVEQEATRVLVALRRYELARGELPGRLEDLTPVYLDAVPVDPFSGRSLLWDREREIVYSVGADRVDQGGSAMQVKDRREPSVRNSQDQVYSLRMSFEEQLGDAASPDEPLMDTDGP